MVKRHEFTSLAQVFRWRASEAPERLAYAFLGDGEAVSQTLTYGELDRMACAIAAQLRKSVEPGSRVLLLFPPGLDFVAAFVACLYSGMVAVPAFPPRPSKPRSAIARLLAISADAGIAQILTTPRLSSSVHEFAASLREVPGVSCIATDQVDLSTAKGWRDRSTGRADVAFLQYTSGSTGTPKGVVVSHANLLANLSAMHRVVGGGQDSGCVSWLPAPHDMGLISGILLPAFAGYPAYLMPPVAFLQRPARWLLAISRFRATTSGGPNSAYGLCIKRIDPEMRSRLDLSSWRTAFNGSEPVRAETLAGFSDAFGDSGFDPAALVPAYGLAESTLLVTANGYGFPIRTQSIDADGAALCSDRLPYSSRRTAQPSTIVGCGRPIDGSRVLVVDPVCAKPRPAGMVGEIWVQGPSVARGYWNRPADTATTFHGYLAGSGDGPFLRTGDLGLLSDGELYVTGRTKDLIVLAGRNVYPQDVEATVESAHPAICAGCVAAFSVLDAQGEKVAIAAEVDGTGVRASSAQELREIIKHIRTAVGDQHDVPIQAVALLKRGAIPKTTSGKLMRQACRRNFEDGTLNAWALWTPTTFEVLDAAVASSAPSAPLR